MNKYKNFSVGDLLYSDKKHEEEMAKYTALNNLAAQPAKSNTLIYAIPVVGIIIVGVIIAIVLKKRK